MGSPLMLGIGLVLLAAGVVTILRGLRGDPANQRAVYGRRITGMMLFAGGLALTAFNLALGHWS
ncbi:hypothetical protein [Novosphingobium sp.]|uniref:hypothetical protein n=1 Tax=Novosphingobium sp. TaxID=1874826 RepID=UPI0025EAD0F0|nr:hypothetical protein [Novosphingobium sp.]